MAITHRITCIKCGKPSMKVTGAGGCPSSVCDSCIHEEEDRKRREFFHGLDGLTVEERLRRLEEILYDAPWEKLYRSMNARY